MTFIGEIKKGREIWKGWHGACIWHACIGCGKERWVALRNGQPKHLRCYSCACKLRQSYKEGRIGDGRYIRIKLQPDDFFYSMADKIFHYVREHRLVMAKHLGRCLQSWELVHHKNGDKTDNRIQNLELTTVGSHIRNHSKGYQDGYLKGLYDGHETRIKQLEQRVLFLEIENIHLSTELEEYDAVKME